MPGDTAAMLQSYLQRGDTAAMLQYFIERSDTAAMLAPYISRSDTAAMLNAYTRYAEFLDSVAAVRADVGAGGDASVVFVNTLSGIAAADTTKMTIFKDTLRGGVFVHYSNSNLVDPDSGVVVTASTGGGKWIRQFTGNLKVEWWGAKGDGTTDDHEAFNGAFEFIRQNASPIYTIELRQGRTYLFSGRARANDIDFRILGNGATIKRENLVSTTLNTLAINGQNYVEVVNSAVFAAGDQVVVRKSGTDATSYNHSAVMTISSINGDSLIFTSNLADNNPSSPAGDYAVGAQVYRSFDLFYFSEASIAAENSAEIVNLKFDGNKDNFASPYTWTVDRSINSEMHLKVNRCSFSNQPSEAIMCNQAIVENSFWQNCIGSATHYSYGSTDTKAQHHISIFRGNLVYDVCQIDNDHNEGAVVWSNAVGNVLIEANTIDTSGFGILGVSDNTTVGNLTVRGNIFRNGASIHTLNYNTDERKEIRWENNKITNCGRLFYQYLTDSNNVYLINNEFIDSCQVNISRGAIIHLEGNLFRKNYDEVIIQEPKNATIINNVFYNTSLSVINTWGADIIENRFYNESTHTLSNSQSSFIYITSYPSNYASQRINIERNVIRENNDNNTGVFRGIFLNAYNFQANIIGNEIYKVEKPFRIINLSSGGDSLRLIRVDNNLAWCVPRTSTSTGTNAWDADIILTSGSVWHNNWLWASKEVRDFLRPAGGITPNNHFEFIGNQVWSENNGMDIIEGTSVSDQGYYGLWIGNIYNGNVRLADYSSITDTKNYTISDRNLNLQIAPNFQEPVDFVEW